MNSLTKVYQVLIAFGIYMNLFYVIAQLDLPPITSKKNMPINNIVLAKAKVLPNSYAVKIIENNDEGNDSDEDKSDLEPNNRGASTDFDRDRNLRYGPPYTEENNRQFYQNNYNNNNYGDNLYNRSYGNDERYYANRNPYTNNNSDDEKYYANRNRYPNDDEKYYNERYPNRDQDYYKNNNEGNNNDKYYANRNIPRDPNYRNEYDRGRYGDKYNPQVKSISFSGYSLIRNNEFVFVFA